MLIDDADKPAKWYFALKQARLDADSRSQKRETGCESWGTRGNEGAAASDGWAGGVALA